MVLVRTIPTALRQKAALVPGAYQFTVPARGAPLRSFDPRAGRVTRGPGRASTNRDTLQKRPNLSLISPFRRDSHAHTAPIHRDCRPP